MWLVVAENSADGAASHFECLFHVDDQPAEQDSGDLKITGAPRSSFDGSHLTGAVSKSSL
jgi:hypothetical protein